jgi:hypothetical protein
MYRDFHVPAYGDITSSLAGEEVVSKKVYALIDEHDNVIEAVRGDGVIINPEEGWIDVSDEPRAHELTEVRMQRRCKVRPGFRMASGHKKKPKMELKPNMRFKVKNRHIKADGEDAAIVVVEPTEETEHNNPIRLMVNGKSCTVMPNEELKITSAVPQRIGVRDDDPDVVIKPRAFFVQASTKGGKS